MDNTCIYDLIGDIEELNSFIGNIDEIQLDFLNNIQIWLLDLITLIKNPNDKYIFDNNLEYTKKIEDATNNMESKLPKLNNLIIPKGSINITRSICKRVERKMIKIKNDYDYIDDNIIIFMNKLSNYLFQLSRYAHFIVNKKEIIYHKSDIINVFENMKL